MPVASGCGSRFLSTPSARRATDFAIHRFFAILISIHALREEGDRLLSAGWLNYSNFYPRPPRGGRRKALNRWDFAI